MKLILTFVVMSCLFSSTLFAAKCTEADAKKAVLAACKDIEGQGKAGLKPIAKRRHCGTNYVWIQDSDVKMVMHPIKPKLNGKPLGKLKDKNGTVLFTEFDKSAKANKDGGWVKYVWPKPGAEKATPKKSFVKMCGGKLKWIAGSGVWVN